MVFGRQETPKRLGRNERFDQLSDRQIPSVVDLEEISSVC